jgi:hypothetical protein
VNEVGFTNQTSLRFHINGTGLYKGGSPTLTNAQLQILMAPALGSLDYAINTTASSHDKIVVDVTNIVLTNPANPFLIRLTSGGLVPEIDAADYQRYSVKFATNVTVGTFTPTGTDEAVDGELSIAFNNFTNMTATSLSYTLTPGGATGTFSLTAGGSPLTADYEDLDNGTTYTVTLTADIKDR